MNSNVNHINSNTAIHHYKTIALIGCSNGLPESDNEMLKDLCRFFDSAGVDCRIGDYIFENSRAGVAPKERAQALNNLFADPEVDMIFDISGGDRGNELLPFLDWEAIRNSRAIFHGYSDLTTIINGIYAQTGKTSVLFQVKTILWDESGEQRWLFEKYLNGDDELFLAEWVTLQGKGSAQNLIENERVLGGNIRCFLKLAGTPYFPELSDSVLFLESMGGSTPQISTYMAQLSQMGVFHKVKGILLGTYTQMIREEREYEVYEILKSYVPEDLFVAKTKQIGHGKNSRALHIG
ncbi:MAG: LD-carboxypeptidase [Eubacteriales bacterium]|nr:LD-carboxypeptidase [Eubacteriales bacterium]